MTLADILLRQISLGGGDDLALVHGVTEWSFSELAARAAAIGQVATASLGEGQSVGVIGANHADTVAAYYGVPSEGRLLTFLNHRLADAEIASQIERAGVGLVIASEPEAARLERMGASLELLPFGCELPDADAALGSGAEGLAWLLFTSGTTGQPKGALLTHASLLAAIGSSSEARPIPPDDVFAFPFPLCHVAGYNVLRNHAAGRPVVLLDRFDAAVLVSVVEERSVTSISLAATMLSDLLDHLEAVPGSAARLRSLRTISYGASPMPVELLLRADSLLGVDLSQGFGMTELSGNAVFLDAADHRRGLSGDAGILSAAGRPGPGVEIKIVDAHDRGLDDGEVGEIAIRGAQVMAGYLDDPDATAAALRGGWMHTGDLGRIRPDGLLEVVDRLKDMIVTGGENVASLEVERAITASFPEVSDVAVVGVPDPRWGENVCACVTLVEGASLSIDELSGRLEGILAGFKTPRHLVVLDALPLTHSGKLAKAELRRLLAEQPSLLGRRRGG